MASNANNSNKRKISGLEDITNSNMLSQNSNHKKLRSCKVKSKFYIQQRSPSPTDTSLSSFSNINPNSPRRHQRNKSVTFASDILENADIDNNVNTNTDDNSNNYENHNNTNNNSSTTNDIKNTTSSNSNKYSHKNYEESPMLTPKEEEDYEYEEVKQTKINAKEINDNDDNEITNSTINTTNTRHPEDLDHNVDYIALSLTLRLLYSSKNSINNQIIHLNKLLDFHRNTAKKEDIIEFILKLLNNELNLPKQNKIIKTPTIEWSKYHEGLSTVNDECFNDEEKPLFKTLHMFD